MSANVWDTNGESLKLGIWWMSTLRISDDNWGGCIKISPKGSEIYSCPKPRIEPQGAVFLATGSLLKYPFLFHPFLFLAHIQIFILFPLFSSSFWLEPSDKISSAGSGQVELFGNVVDYLCNANHFIYTRNNPIGRTLRRGCKREQKRIYKDMTLWQEYPSIND